MYSVEHGKTSPEQGNSESLGNTSEWNSSSQNRVGHAQEERAGERSGDENGEGCSPEQTSQTLSREVVLKSIARGRTT